jgi:type IV secretion system protein VirD4
VTPPSTLPPIVQYAAAAHHWVQAHPVLAYGALGVLFIVVLLIKTVQAKRQQRARQDQTTHGSARWGTTREVRQAGLSRAHGVVVGTLGGDVWLDDLDTPILLLGPTGSLKDACHINPTLAWGWTQSTLNLDCQHGQMYDATGAIRRQYGQVELFAPYQRPRACLNVADTIRVGEPEEFRDALLIGTSLTAPEKNRHESSAGVHFRELAAVTIAAALLHLCYTTSTASLAAVCRFLSAQASFAKAIALMAQTPHTHHGVHEAIAVMSGLLGNLGSGGDEQGSAWSTTMRPLLLYLDPYVALSTDTSTIRLDDLQYGRQALSLYLLAESSHTLAQMYQVYRVILDTTFAVLMRHKPETYAHRLLVVANELPSYGYMQAINKNSSVQRKYGIKGFYIAQDLKQLEDIYGPEPELWANTKCKLFHATGNDRTAKRLSDGYLGTQTVEYLVASHQGRGRRTVTPHRTGRALLTAVEVGELAPEKVIVHLGGDGHKPFLMEKYGYDRSYGAA